MLRRWSYIRTFLALSVLFGLCSSAMAAPDDPDTEEKIPLEKKKKRSNYTTKTNYRYDFGERHLALGVAFSGALSNGNTLNAFPYGGIVTPYFKGGFGDGNALQLDVSVGLNPMSPSEYGWLYWRTPVLPGSSAGGYLAFVAPNLQFRYEIDLGSSISKRSPILFWGGAGVGPFISMMDTQLINNGAAGEFNKNTTAQQIFLDFVPTAGLKLRLGSYGYFDVGLRAHLLFRAAYKIGEETSFSTGRPDIIPEGYISGGRVFDLGVGFSYDFK